MTVRQFTTSKPSRLARTKRSCINSLSRALRRCLTPMSSLSHGVTLASSVSSELDRPVMGDCCHCGTENLVEGVDCCEVDGLAEEKLSLWKGTSVA